MGQKVQGQTTVMHEKLTYRTQNNIYVGLMKEFTSILVHWFKSEKLLKI